MRRETPDVRTRDRVAGELAGAPPGPDQPAEAVDPPAPVADPDPERQRRWSSVIPVAQPVERVVVRVGIRRRLDQEAPPR
jgi:hypothetical protein